MKTKLTENKLRHIIRESLKQAINEIYSFNGYFDTEIDLDECFGMYVDNEEFYNNRLHVRVYFKQTPASRGDYDVPGTEESYYYKGCEPEQREWENLVALSGLGEEKLREILDDYLYGNIDELIK